MEQLSAKASIQIQQSAEKVFQAISTAQGMSNYFIASGTGDLATNETVLWTFPEFPDSFPVTGKEIKPNEYISFDWSGGKPNCLVELFLIPQHDGSTVVKVVEGVMDKTNEGINQMMQQTEGWANFLACLKAYLDYGINLRKGAFAFMSTK
ncbi:MULTISPECIES: SRPBCC domain-containing protein [unclassified Flavobacterium]|uniref:SRPBCC domain-containing protein n=1 Tax=unclassified Flavobacterium TaxID=196869 RepID=UPI0013D445ED|nr:MULTISPECIES: SRPBCC domain-containing protein [unclassified Flavobacterium]MBA5792520.1 SRPBCC domain-containing protein [Flavobacterium sp. xlx-221]